MSKFVWEMRAVGGAPNEIRVAVEQALDRLREGRSSITDEGTLEAFSRDVIALGVIDAASLEGKTSVLIEAETRDESSDRIAAELTNGFEDEVLDAVMALDGVTEAHHTDRINR